jgi:hypothetical protein
VQARPPGLSSSVVRVGTGREASVRTGSAQPLQKVIANAAKRNAVAPQMLSHPKALASLLERAGEVIMVLLIPCAITRLPPRPRGSQYGLQRQGLEKRSIHGRVE